MNSTFEAFRRRRTLLILLLMCCPVLLADAAWTMIDGVVTTSPKTGNQSGNHFDFAAIEESTVQTVANNADSPTRGIQMNVILRSGADDFHGSAFWAQSSQRLQSNNVDDTLRAQGVESGNAIDAR